MRPSLSTIMVMLAPLATANQSPDLVLILADDMGAETVGCYGGESYATPELDRLAQEGIRLSAAFTQPLCTPTRIEVLTGRSNARNYVGFSVLDPEERTFAHELREHGYRTLAIGKWQLLAAEHYPPEIQGSGTRPEDAGFDHHALWQVDTLGSRHWGPRLVIDGETREFSVQRYGPDVALEHGLRWMDEAGEQPVLLFWPMILPHGPFVAPPGTEGPRSKSDPAMYGPMVEYVDQLVGRLMAHLRQRERECLVLFLGDNGTPRSITSQWRGAAIDGGKAQVRHHGSHVPFLAWWPGQLPAGEVRHDPVSSVDVFATLLEAADRDLPARALDGWSLLPYLDGRVALHREWVTFHHHPRPRTRDDLAQRWARDRDWQLFEDGRLFHVGRDPLLEHPIEADDADASLARERLGEALRTLPHAGDKQHPPAVRPKQPR